MDAGLIALGSAGLAGLGLAAGAALRAWRGWLELQRAQLTGGRRPEPPADLGRLRERVRRLEAIADGRTA